MRTRSLQKILVFLLLLKGAAAAADLRLEDVRLVPLADIAGLPADDGRLSGESFRRIVLLFSGIGPEQVDAYERSFRSIMDETAAAFAGRARDQRFADDLLQYLHRRHLKRYDALETSLAALLDSGVYNCVSSSVLYMAAADAVGLAVSGVRTPDHAFVTVSIRGQTFDVETTTSYGFDPGKKKEFTNEFGRITGFVYTPPGNYSDRRAVSRREMAGLILNNRIAGYTKSGRFDLATGPGADLFELLKNEEALTMLVGIYAGASRRALDTRRFETGYAILDRAASAYRDFDQFQELRRLYVLEWTTALVEAGTYASAQDLITREHDRGKVSEADYRTMLLLRYHREAEAAARDGRRGPAAALEVIASAKSVLGGEESLLQAERAHAHNLVLVRIGEGKYDDASRLIVMFRAEKTIDERALRTLELHLFQKKAEASARSERFAEALSVIEEGLARLGREEALLKSAGVYAYNRALKLLADGDFPAAGEFIRGPVLAAYSSPKTRDELLVHLVKAKVERHRTKGEAEESLMVLEQGMAEMGLIPDLLRSYETAIHNHMIGFYERQDFAGAEAVIRRGLKFHPASGLLKSDLEKIKALSQR